MPQDDDDFKGTDELSGASSAAIGHNGGPSFDDDRATNWFCVSRDIFDHAIVGIHDRQYTEFEAWLSLVAMAEFKPRRVLNKGQMIVLDPGDLMAAHAYLATRWKWTADKVRWFLKRLQTDAMITRECAKLSTSRNTNQIQVISICNYAKYQLIQDAEHQAKHQPSHQANTKPTPSAHQANTKKLTLKHLNTPTQKESEEREEREDGALPLAAGAAPAPLEALKAFEAYNELAQRVGIPLARSLTPQRRKALQARLREHGGYPSWETLLANVERSAFLQGRNDKSWTPPGLDWFLNASNFTKVFEGAYGNGAHAKPAPKETEWERMSRLMGDTARNADEIEILPPMRRL